MTAYTVGAGVTSSGMVLSAGDTLDVVSGGTVTDVTVTSGGAAYIRDGGVANTTTAGDGGAVFVYAGGTPSGTIIQGGGSVEMTGVVYMPKRVIEVGGNGNINANSNYFGMIADSFYLIGNGTIYLKADNAAANMPLVLPQVTSLARLTN